MRIQHSAACRGHLLPTLLAFGLLAAGTRIVASETPTAVAPAPPTATPLAEEAPSTDARIVVVEWKIKKGHEQEFLDYWATKSTVPDRSGLVAEFMSSEESRDRFPWINWVNAESADYSTFYNIGIWRKSEDFMGQIGKYIDNNRPPMPFEADHRHRVFLEPVKWRIGVAALPAKDAKGVR